MLGADRSSEVDKAARLVTRGDLKGAVRIYARLFQEDPEDWSVGNTLGDLYVRTGASDQAIAHFTALAEHLAADGFAAKARALYRKILRIDPVNAEARHRVDELEKQQVGQTSPFLQRVLQTALTLRETETPRAEESRAAATGEPHGVAAVPMPPPVSIPAAPAAPADVPDRSAAPLSSPPTSGTSADAGLFVPERLAAPTPSASQTPAPSERRSAAGWADEWTTVDIAPEPSPSAALPPEREALRPEGTAPRPEPPAMRPESSAPSQEAPARRPSMPAPPAPADAASEFRYMAAQADEAAARYGPRAAVAVVEGFLAMRPHHIAALEKLIDLGVDGSLGAEVEAAQVRLAEACLRAERYTQAYYAVLDLMVRNPRSRGHRELFERVRAVARESGRTFAPLLPIDAQHLQEEETAAAAESSAAPPPPSVAEAPESTDERPAVRILRPDFTEAPRVARSKADPAATGRPEATPSSPDPLTDLLADLADPEVAFESIRDALLEEAAAAAEERFAEGTRHLEARRFDEAVRAFEEAMCAPHLRVSAGSRLARIYREQGAAMEALTCLEWVAEIPPSSEEAGHELAYELALTLESLGQHAQALGLYRELLAEVGPGYRDIEARTRRLAVA